jgi:hypothetical protein
MTQLGSPVQTSKNDYTKRLEYLIHWYVDHIGSCEGIDFLHHFGKTIDAPEAQEILDIYDKVEKENDIIKRNYS